MDAMMADDPAECVIEDDRWTGAEGLQPRCLAAVSAALSRLEAPRAGAAVILFTTDKTVQALNARWRGKDRPTNVLSFPAPATEDYPGDVALAYETCEREARQKGVALIDHAAHLTVHGVLHLNGLDHQDEAAAEAMEAIETAALAQIGIADPYSQV